MLLNFLKKVTNSVFYENEEMIVAVHRNRNREVTGSNPVEVLNFFQASLRNCINCVHCDDHFFIFMSFPQFIYDLFHISLTVSFIFAAVPWL